MTWRRALVWVLAAGAAVLSFDALRAYALGAPPLAGGVIPTRTIVHREWLAALWAIEIDLAAAVGILGIRDNRKDPLAWLTFIAAGVASVGFQVFSLPTVAARAVPPMALFLAIVVLELPRTRPAWTPIPTPLGHPVPEPNAEPEPDPEPEPDQDQPDQDAPQPRPSQRRVLSQVERDRVAALAAEGRSRAEITRDLGLSDRHRKTLVGPLVDQVQASQVGHRNGNSPGGGA